MGGFIFRQTINRKLAWKKLNSILKRIDPLYERCIHMMAFMLHGVPKRVLEHLEKDMWSDPMAFFDLYEDIRHVAEHVEHTFHARRQKVRQIDGSV